MGEFNKFVNKVNKVFDDLYEEVFQRNDAGSDFKVKTNIYETDSEYIFQMELPGVSKQEATLQIKENVLTVKGTKSETKFETDLVSQKTERKFGEFRTSFSLPENLDLEKVKASFKDGVLHITIPKLTKTQANEEPTNINIE